jgi:pimeloyl-ACP methyl ester carboxylesterase
MGGFAVDENDIPDQVDRARRHFLSTAGTAALAAGAAGLGVMGAADAQASPAKRAGRTAVVPGTSASLGPVKQVKAGLLNVGYVAAGPADGRPVILMHGFPYDIHSYVEVAPLLAAEGYRVIVPYFRGYGTTTFQSSATPRSAEQASFALDILALMDELKIHKAILAGFDWGSRTGDIIAALWPGRCRALVSVSGYLITSLAAEKKPLPPKAEWAWWYQYYFATERGVLGLTDYRRDLGELIWKFNSPTWHFDTATYDRTAAAFRNPDYVPIVINNYRWRLSLAKSEPQYASVEARLQQTPVIAVPTITIDGEYDPFTAPGHGAAYRDRFSGKYAHETLPVGHNVPQEAPRAFAEAVLKVDSF